MTVIRKALLLALATGSLAGLCACPGPVPLVKDDYDTFDRPDGSKVYCQRVPVEIINTSSKASVDVTVKQVHELVKAGGEIKLTPERVTATSLTLNDYRVIERQLCLDYGGGAYSAEQYRAIREKILPAIDQKAHRAPLVDSEIEVGPTLALSGRKRVPLTLHIFPVSDNPNVMSSVIFAAITVGDEARLEAAHVARVVPESCIEVPSCLAAHVWDQFASPLLVPGGSREHGARISWSVDLKPEVTAIHVFWETYQSEADNGAHCAIDSSKPAPQDGVPYLQVLDEKGEKLRGKGCYRSSGDRIVQL